MSRTSLLVPARAANATRNLVLNLRWWTYHLLNWKTTTQVVGLVIATLLASILLLTAFHVRSRSLSAFDERRDFGVSQGEHVERFLFAAGGDIQSPEAIARIQYFVEDIGSVGGLTAIFFVDREGRVLAHSSRDMVGGYYRNPDLVETFKTGKVVTAKEQEDGLFRLDVVVPVRYEGEIVGAIEGQFSLELLSEETASAQRDGLISALIVGLILIPAAAFVVARTQRTLERMAITDGLSGLYDHRYFRHRLDEEIGRSERYGHELALILFDIDGFKGYNDAYGHMAGDEAIQQIARALRSGIREVDIPARYGGEEFAVILPETGVDRAYLVAERIRLAINRFVGPSNRARLLTASFGVAAYPADAGGSDDLIRCADAALYYAKLSGKNCSCAYASVPKQCPLSPAGSAI